MAWPCIRRPRCVRRSDGEVRLPAIVHIEGTVTPAHPECGNGVTWSLEAAAWQHAAAIGSGEAQGPAEVKVGPFDGIAVQRRRCAFRCRLDRAMAIIRAT